MQTQKVTKARVTALLGRTGSRGGITQVRVTLIGTGQKQRNLIRNVKGPVKVGDILDLMQCQRQARRLR